MYKKKAQQNHAEVRFFQRGSFQFSKKMNNLFCSYIHGQKNVKFIGRTSNRVTVWDITHEGKIYRCVYDKERKQIVTLLKTFNPIEEVQGEVHQL